MHEIGGEKNLIQTKYLKRLGKFCCSTHLSLQRNTAVLKREKQQQPGLNTTLVWTLHLFKQEGPALCKAQRIVCCFTLTDGNE